MSQEEPPHSDVHVEIRIGDSETAIEFPTERVTVSCPVTQVGDRLYRYRLDGVPMSESAAFQDVIEADNLRERRLRFLRVAQPGRWKTFDFLFPRGWLDGERGVSLLRELDQKGLYWERVLGGILFVCVPPESTTDPGALVDATVGPGSAEGQV